MIRSFTICAIFASYAAAVCTNATDDASDMICDEFPEMQDAIATYAQDVSFRWETVTTADGYHIRMIRFIGDVDGNPFVWEEN